jgi:hypothetical protein
MPEEQADLTDELGATPDRVGRKLSGQLADKPVFFIA